jgi:hypothetical protein
LPATVPGRLVRPGFPLHGRDNLARLLIGLRRTSRREPALRLSSLMDRYASSPDGRSADQRHGGDVSSALVTALHVIANPEKMHGLGHAPPEIL